MAGEAEVTPGAGSAAAAALLAGEAAKPVVPSEIPADLMPLVERKFDERLGKIKAQWEADAAEARKRSEMSEIEKLRADHTAATEQLKALQAQATNSTRAAELVARSGGKVSLDIAEKVVSTHQGDWNADAALQAGLAQATALLKAWGFDPGAPAPAPAFPTQGGGTRPADKGKWTDQQIAEAVRTGAMKLDEANRLWDAKASAS